MSRFLKGGASKASALLERANAQLRGERISKSKDEDEDDGLGVGFLLNFTLLSYAYGHMGGINFAAENRMVTWRCDDCTFSKEMYCVA